MDERRIVGMRGILAFSTILLTVIACSSSGSPQTTSSVDGRLTVPSFKVPPSGVDAVDERNIRVHAGVGPDGAFHLTLGKAHVYQLVVVGPGGEEPIVYPRATGQLHRSFRLSSGAAIVSLGAVRHLDSAPSGGFAVQAAEKEDGECANGVLQGTNQPCVDDDHVASCADGKTSTGAPDGDAETADPNQPMAVPELNPPTDVAGCNENDEGDGDGETAD